MSVADAGGRWAGLLRGDRVVPVYTPGSVDEAVEVGHALLRGGLHSVEVTLRTPAAMDAIAALSDACPALAVGAGTVVSVTQMDRARDAGARFAVSPGSMAPLMRHAAGLDLPYLPGVATSSELMAGLAAGHAFFKLFPAEPIDALALAKAWRGVFPDARFCPTGGIDPGRARAYLAQPNVACVGGSWLTPPDALAAGDWARIEALARDAAGMSAG